MSNEEQPPQKHISSLTASNPSQKQSSNSNNYKKNLHRFKSHLTYFSPKADSQRKTKIFLNETKTNKKKENQLNNDENRQKIIGSSEKISYSQFSTSYSVEIAKNLIQKSSDWVNKSKNVNISIPNNSNLKSEFSINNVHSNKLQKKTARFEKILQEDSIQELANEENEENNNQLQNNNKNNNKNINNKKILNVSKLELDNNININLSEIKKTKENNKNEDDLNKSLLKNSKKGDKEKVLEILSNKDKININYQNENGWSALHFACDEGNLKVVEILIKAHIELNLTNNEKKTPLHISVSHGYFDISKLLIENNANLDCVDNEKNLAIHLCALHGHNELLSYMLEKKSSYINEQNLYGNTAFDLAKNLNTKKIIEKYINKFKGKIKKQNSNLSNKKIKTKAIENKKKNYLNKDNKGFCKIVIHKTNKKQVKALMSPINNEITNTKMNNNVIENNNNTRKNNEYNNINVLHNNIQRWNNKYNNYINVNNKNNNSNHNKNNSINNSNTNNINTSIMNNNSTGNINNSINATPTKKNNNSNKMVLKKNELSKKDIIKCNINPNTTKKIKKSSKCFNTCNNQENISKSSMKLKLINLNNLNNNCSDSNESSKNFNHNYNYNNSNNLYYNTNSHIKTKSKKKYQIETNINSNLNININSKEFKSPYNIKRSNEYFHPTTEKKSSKTFKIPKYDINISTNNNSLYKEYSNSNSKINTYMNIKNKINKCKSKIKTEGNNKSQNKFIICNLANNNKIKKAPHIISKENKKNSKIKFSKRTVSLPGFLNNSNVNNTSELSEKNINKTNTIKNNKEKLNLNKAKNKSKKNMYLPKTYSNIRNNNIIKNNSIKPGNSHKDIILNKHNKLLTNQNLNFKDKNMDIKINIDKKEDEIKFEKICTDEDNNLIEDLEEEEIIVNLKDKEKSSKNENNKSSIGSKIDSNTLKNDKFSTNSKSENKHSTQKNTVNTQIEEIENFNNNSNNDTNENANIDSYSESENENDENSKNNIEKIGPGDFICLALLGQGSFGEVYLVKKKDSNNYYAMKVLDKKKIKKQNIFKYAMTERNVLSILNYPFIVKLNYAFQTNDKLFLLLDYCPGGDLSKQLSIQTRFSEDKAKFYICEIILALGELHKHDIIFRDLKPDNIIIDKEGHAMLTDFGLSREGVNDKQIAKSFCGSIAYLAPEMLNRSGHGKSVDWYLLGVVFFEMLVGIPPYFSNSQEQIFKNIEKAELYIPNFISKNAQKLIKELLKRNPNERLGAKNDVEDIMKHVYFQDVDWGKVYRREYIPPPIIYDENSVKFYGCPKIFGNNESVSNNNDLYEGWSFVNNNIKGVDSKNDRKCNG